jgi:hypothetical protein
MQCRWIALLILFLFSAVPLLAQEGGANAKDKNNDDLELVEKLLIARRDYQKILEDLRGHYVRVGDVERAKWAEEELIQFHRIPKQAFRLELDVPPPTLKGTTNVPAANRLYTRAMFFKGHGWNTDYIDNQRRAELLLQELLTKYPQSNRISDAAYQLGDIYENAPYKHYKRAAIYFERCYQWNDHTQFDARLRAAHIYERYLKDYNKALDIYKDTIQHETEPARIQEAVRRSQEITAQRK